jgi:hypothetical protein
MFVVVYNNEVVGKGATEDRALQAAEDLLSRMGEDFDAEDLVATHEQDAD